MADKENEAFVHFVKIKGRTYLLREDVVMLIMEIAGTENTDVRDRLNFFARSLFAVGE